jgi:hypothetical protein
MNEVMLAMGRAVVKILISLFAGAGIGLVTFGLTVRDTPDLWLRPGPPPGFFLALGMGLLTTAILMTILFYFPRPRKDSPLVPAKGSARDAWSE